MAGEIEGISERVGGYSIARGDQRTDKETPDEDLGGGKIPR